MLANIRQSLPPVAARHVNGGFSGLLEEGPRTLSISIRPMEELYTYQAFALANAIAYLKANPTSTLRVDLTDLEFDMQRGLGFLPYSKSPQSAQTCDRVAEVVQAASVLDASIPARVSIWRFSERLTADPGFMDHISKLFDKKKAREAKILISKKTGRSNHLPLAPICPECDHASSSFGILSEDRTRLSATCSFAGCKDLGREFSVDIKAPASFCLFYLFDSVGDGYNDPKEGRTDVHMLGIDPKRRWVNGMALYEVIGRLTAIFTEDYFCPSYYPAMRVIEIGSLYKKSKFSGLLQEHSLSVEEALNRMISIAEKYDGKSEIQISDLKASLASP